MFLQISGQKLAVLFPGTDYDKMYPFPVGHPCDRQSMADVTDPDLKRWPKFKEGSGQYTVLREGDLLYLPYGWWHYMRNQDDMSVSVSFWSMTSSLEVKDLPSKLPAKLLAR